MTCDAESIRNFVTCDAGKPQCHTTRLSDTISRSSGCAARRVQTAGLVREPAAIQGPLPCRDFTESVEKPVEIGTDAQISPINYRCIAFCTENGTFVLLLKTVRQNLTSALSRIYQDSCHEECRPVQPKFRAPQHQPRSQQS